MPVKRKETVVILGVSADIGKEICLRYLRDGYSVLGTYRVLSENVKSLRGKDNLTLFRCDLSRPKEIEKLASFAAKKKLSWKTFFSSVGTTEPIGRFFALDFDAWADSIHINGISQLRALHALYRFRSKESVSNVVFLAGGGTNNPFRCYSAYCLAKIMLIKMCELIDDENPDLNAFIVGPGFVRTKNHYETLRAGTKAEANLARVKDFWGSGKPGTSMDDIYGCMRWLEVQGRDVAGGRNFSVVHDDWGKELLARQLKGDLNMYKLRRFGNDWKSDIAGNRNKAVLATK